MILGKTCSLAAIAMAASFAFTPGSALAQVSQWQANHDGGWQAYREGRLAEAERLLRAAETEARSFGAGDPRLGRTLDPMLGDGHPGATGCLPCVTTSAAIITSELRDGTGPGGGEP